MTARKKKAAKRKKPAFKSGDKVWYVDPVRACRKNDQTLHEWVVTSVWPTNTEYGDVASLKRPDETKTPRKKGDVGEDLCNALVSKLSRTEEGK